MAKQWCYFLFLLWFSYLIVSAILMFTRGFLLTRVQQKEVSECTHYTEIPCTLGGSSILNITNGHEYRCSEQDKLLSLLRDINSASITCLPQRAKVILVVIDAFKYDFALHNYSLKDPYPFQNKLPVINKALKESPELSRLYKFIADPPTTTMQRLKGLTTGSLPTFIDAGSNFATPEISEDNLIDQILKQNKTAIFMGDDTWQGLYPNRFKRSYPFPSFNVWDLDTVDNGVKAHIYKELKKDDWNLLVAHFLGVDHCGHRYGPFHPEMARKLTEMNEVIRNLISNIDESTVLIVIGDHGMTKTGDHGGESEDEITAAMFAYSKTPFLPINTQMRNDPIKQVDLVPTLSTLLGIPVPYASLGSLIYDALPTTVNSNNTNSSPLADWQLSFLSTWSIVKQMTTYIKQYASSSDQFNSDKLDLLLSRFTLLSAKARSVDSENLFKKFAIDAKEYTNLIRQMCEEVWIQFDSFSMSRGLLLMFLTIFFVYMIVDGIPNERLPEIFKSSFLLCSYLAMFGAACVSAVCYYFSLVENLELAVFFSTGMVSVFMLAMLVIQNWELISTNWYNGAKRCTLNVMAFRVMTLLSLCALFSNSFILEEASVLAFFLITLVAVLVYEFGNEQQNTVVASNSKAGKSPKSKFVSIKVKLIMLAIVIGMLIRCTAYFWRCREESKWCNLLDIVNTSSDAFSTMTRMESIVSLLFIAVYATLIRLWLRACGNLVGVAPAVTVARYAPTAVVVCTGGFWVLHSLPVEIKQRLLAPWQADLLALTVYALVTLSLSVIFWKPLCIYILPRKKELVSVYGRENNIPQLFKQVKGLFGEKREADKDPDSGIPIVYGLGTVYSGVFVLTSVFMCLLWSLLLGDVLAPGAVIMYGITVGVLIIISVHRFEKATSIEKLFEVPSSSLLAWMLLSLYSFYATGHQPAFPSIQWEAAFVGTGGTFPYNFIPATLIGINTFGAHILMGATLPLLIITPFTLYIMYPSLMPPPGGGADFHKDFSRGELLLYERDGHLLNGVFVISCKYILLFGIRMFICMLAATVHCRHLMVWMIFAPKLIFEALGMFVSLGAVMAGYFLLMRINNHVDTLVTGLSKQSR